MKAHPYPRTFGVKLREPKSNSPKTQFPVITRRMDIEHYNRTGEVKYLDEEEKTMTKQDSNENAKKMREEVTTLAIFNSIGNYREVASKYHVGATTAHAHKRHLANLEKGADKVAGVEIIHNPSLEQIEQFHTDGIVQTLPEIESIDQCNLSEASLNTAPQSGAEAGDPISEITEFDKGLEDSVEKLEAEWGGDPAIEQFWRLVESDLNQIRELYMERAQKEFQERLAKIIKAC